MLKKKEKQRPTNEKYVRAKRTQKCRVQGLLSVPKYPVATRLKSSMFDNNDGYNDILSNL